MSPEAIVTGISVSIILAVLAIWIAFKLAAGTRGIMKGIKEQFNEIEELRDDISARLKDLDSLIELGKLNAAEHEAERARGGMGFGSPRSLALKRIQREDNPNAVVEVKGIVEQDGVCRTDAVACESMLVLAEELKKILDRLFVLEYKEDLTGDVSDGIGAAMIRNRSRVNEIQDVLQEWKERIHEMPNGSAVDIHDFPAGHA